MNKPAFLKLSISMVIFGSIGFFSKYTGLPALELVFVRCVSASAILAVYWFATGQYKKERWNIKEMLFILGGGVMLVINWLFLFLAFEKTSVTVAISIYNTAPLIVLVAGWTLFREKFGRTACHFGGLYRHHHDYRNSFLCVQPRSPGWVGLRILCGDFLCGYSDDRHKDQTGKSIPRHVSANIHRGHHAGAFCRLFKIHWAHSRKLDIQLADRCHPYRYRVFAVLWQHPIFAHVRHLSPFLS